MKFTVSVFRRVVALNLFILLSSAATQAFTLDDLRADQHLTPDRMIHYFAAFKFELGEDVQPPKIFLARQAGDCDDFATLAADVLKEKGYTTKLVVVFMPKDIHVVCYVKEIKAYLDYNNRALCNPLVASDGSLSDIAEKVAKSFAETWHCVSEYTYKAGVRHFVYTDFRQVAPATASTKAAASGRALAVIGSKK